MEIQTVIPEKKIKEKAMLISILLANEYQIHFNENELNKIESKHLIRKKIQD